MCKRKKNTFENEGKKNQQNHFGQYRVTNIMRRELFVVVGKQRTMDFQTSRNSSMDF